MSGMLVLKPRALDNHTKPCTFSANGGNSGSIFSLSGNIHFNSMQRACCFRRTQRTDLSFYLGPIIKADKENEAEIQPFSFLPRQKWAFNLVVRWTLICKRWWHRLPLFFPSPSRRKCEKWRSEQHLGKKAFQWRTLPHKDVGKMVFFFSEFRKTRSTEHQFGAHTHAPPCRVARPEPPLANKSDKKCFPHRCSPDGIADSSLRLAVNRHVPSPKGFWIEASPMNRRKQIV